MACGRAPGRNKLLEAGNKDSVMGLESPLYLWREWDCTVSARIAKIKWVLGLKLIQLTLKIINILNDLVYEMLTELK